MAEHGTKIEWTHIPGYKGETWNPIVGCSLASPGCTNCYAMRAAGARLDGNPLTPHYLDTTKMVNSNFVWSNVVARASQKTLTAPLRWKKPRAIFVNSMGDLFHEGVPDEWIDQVFAVMALCPQHIFIVLTKRAERMRKYCDGLDEFVVQDTDIWREIDHRVCCDDPPNETRSYYDATARFEHAIDSINTLNGSPLPNVWLGVSVEDQRRAEERIPHLLATPAAQRFVSCEPLIGPVDLVPWLHLCSADRDGECSQSWCPQLRDNEPYATGRHCPCDRYPDDLTEAGVSIDWVIVGGESGPNARPMHPDWVRSLRDQCVAGGVPFFFKQWGEWANRSDDTFPLIYKGEDRIFTCEGEVIGAGNGVDGLVDPDWREKGAAWMVRVGKARAGRLLDGREWNECPEFTRETTNA